MEILQSLLKSAIPLIPFYYLTGHYIEESYLSIVAWGSLQTVAFCSMVYFLFVPALMRRNINAKLFQKLHHASS
jgi:hypothetical protein